MRPLLYNGTSNPDTVEGWVREINKKIDTIDILMHFRAILDVYKLTREVDYWQDSVNRGRNLGTFAWKEFEEFFYEIFFNKIEKSNKVIKFMNLKQKIWQQEIHVQKNMVARDSDNVVKFLMGL